MAAQSQLRQSQLKEWLRAAPQLFVSDLLREQKFETLLLSKIVFEIDNGNAGT